MSSGAGNFSGVSKLKPNMVGRFVFNTAMIVFSVVNVFPIIWMVYSSLKTKQEYLINVFALPSRFLISNYFDAIRVGKLHIGLLNSVLNSTVAVASIVVLAFVIGYCFARFSFPGKKIIYTLLIAGMLIPIHALMVPLFIQFRQLNLINRQFTLVLPYIAFGLPLAVFLMEGFIRQMPTEVEEAAWIDGSSFFNTLLLVVAPMSRPVISTAIIIAFMDAWNEFSFALILISNEQFKTLPVFLTGFAGIYTVDFTKMFAALVIATMPVLILYIFLSNKIIEGMVAGAVKG